MKLIGQALCLMALYVGVLLVIVEPASVHCTADPTSQGGWIFLTLLSPPIWLVPFCGLLLVRRVKRFVAQCALVVGMSCLQVLVSFVLFCGFGR